MTPSVWHSKFSQRCWWRFKSSWTLLHVDW